MIISEHFLTDIEIKQFKCFSNFKAKGFKRVNLIGGKNNIGKTAFMEACYINVHSQDLATMLTAIGRVKYNREKINLEVDGYPNDFFISIEKYNVKSNIGENSFLKSTEIFPSKYFIKLHDDEEKYIIVLSDLKNFEIHHLGHIDFIDNVGLSNESLSLIYEDVQKQDKENLLNKYLNEFDSNIKNFKIIGDNPQCKVQGEYRDITEFGDGLKHYISIICALYACENGYLFIDEIDNGIHYTQLDPLWEIILTVSKETNCQVFATTHSKEMIDSFARVSEKLNDEKISYTTIIKNKALKLVAITRDYEGFLGSLEDEREVRGR